MAMVTTLPIGGWGARRARGPLPLTKRWRDTFITLRAVVITAGAAAAVLLFLGQQLVPVAWALSILGIAAGSFALFAVTGLLYSALRPKGRIHTDTNNARWVVLSDVHPNFAAAVEAMEQSAAGSSVSRSE